MINNITFAKHVTESLKKGKSPCQAVWNKLEVDILADELKSLHKLEKAIICKSNGFISIKLKRKLSNRGHIYFKPVLRDHVQRFLKANNPLYGDAVIAIEQIPQDLITLQNLSDNSCQDKNIHIDEENVEEDENPLGDLRVGSNESMLVSNIPYAIDEENITIVSGEGKLHYPC